MTTPDTTAWADLITLADQEQQALLAVLTRLVTDSQLESQVAAALDYPDWPLPLTLLPSRAAHLTAGTPELAAYAAVSTAATAQVLATLSRWGWPPPTHPAARDAAWLLLQHSDTEAETRRDLLRDMADAWEHRGADPRHLALLTDRDRSLRGEEQRYGTFVLVRDDRPCFLYPTVEISKVDDERQRIGLPTLAEDTPYAYCPITPYRQARSAPVNPPAPATIAVLPPPRTPQPTTHSSAEDSANRHGVYLAATLRDREEIRRVRARMPLPLESTARWIDLDPLTRPSSQFDAGIVLNQLAAQLCIDDIARARLLLAYPLSRRSDGVTTEIGCALAYGKPVIIAKGSPQCSFDMLPSVTISNDIDSALAAACRALTDAA
ncbi:DUF6624 domain-containing protein [Frankia sp. KB5]|uniref:DUF6624 domain-containing protein n=1 Tax=Frankia sp. KB5 TaxID=683318 RepID=UPI000A1165A1|nr:DUF6624 domain-containing protein [Frankia sp. KB5]ORT47370.1 hypothetical protein KBI5_20115 [Frankia sp. KB5]